MTAKARKHTENWIRIHTQSLSQDKKTPKWSNEWSESWIDFDFCCLHFWVSDVSTHPAHKKKHSMSLSKQNWMSTIKMRGSRSLTRFSRAFGISDLHTNDFTVRLATCQARFAFAARINRKQIYWSISFLALASVFSVCQSSPLQPPSHLIYDILTRELWKWTATQE